MKVEVLSEHGYDEAMLGLSLSYNRPVERMPQTAKRLMAHPGDSGHQKFLEFLTVYLDITAPRYWWQQFDTYRIMSKASESTMHTVMKGELTQDDFVVPIHKQILDRLNYLIEICNFNQLKVELPEGFLQRRVVKTDYKTLNHIYRQRKDHRLVEWAMFFEKINLKHPEFAIF